MSGPASTSGAKFEIFHRQVPDVVNLVNLRQLRAFQAVGQLNSVTAAASKLNIAQPALTRQLKELQQGLGVKLLQRQGRGIVLTEAGAFFLERASFLLQEHDRLMAEMRTFKYHSKRRFSFGVPTANAQLFGAALVARIREAEDIDLLLLDGWTGFIVEWLTHGRIDIGIVYDQLAKINTLKSELLAFEQLYLVSTPGDGLARRRSIRLGEAARLPLVMPSRNHALRVFLEAQFNAIGQTVDPVAETDSMSALRSTVAEGGVYSVVSQIEAQADREIALAMVPVTEPDLRRPIYLSWIRSMENSPEGQHCIEVVRRELRKEIAGRKWNVDLP